jgi:hypothetical protein
VDVLVQVKRSFVELFHEMLSKQEVIFLHEAKWILWLKPQNDKHEAKKSSVLRTAPFKKEHK